jgi:hypothetical protein
MNEPPYGILGSMNDSKRCLQYIRYNAQKYNIDKKRIACSGGSAGAGTSLWLAFSDDMAEPESNDLFLRESTKIACAGAFSTQSTYDILRWNQLLNFPDKKSPEELFAIGRAFGFKNTIGIDLYEQTQIRENLDFFSKMNKNSPPFFVYNKMKGGIPTNEDELQHHPRHALKLKEKADEMGVEAVVYAPEIGLTHESKMDFVTFMTTQLKD